MYPRNPLLRWAGSKKRQLRYFRQLFPTSFEGYAEPFAGSASFFFGIELRKSKLNDINQDVMDFYNNCMASTEEFYEVFSSMSRKKEVFNRVRSEFNAMERCREKSILFYYLNRNCFNGIYRVNKNGEFNVPFSDNRVSPYLTKEEFCSSVDIIRNSILSNSDFEEFCENYINKNDFVYLDPPYYDANVKTFREYTVNGFNQEDLFRLHRCLKRLDYRDIKFLITLPFNESTQSFSNEWQSKVTSVYRTVAGNATKRRRNAELLVCNYAKS